MAKGMNVDILQLVGKPRIISLLRLLLARHVHTAQVTANCNTVITNTPEFGPSSFDTSPQCVSLHHRGCLCAGPLVHVLCARRLVPSCTLLTTGWTHFWQCNEQLGWAAGNSTLLTGTAQLMLRGWAQLGQSACIGALVALHRTYQSSQHSLFDSSSSLQWLLYLSCYLVQLSVCSFLLVGHHPVASRCLNYAACAEP